MPEAGAVVTVARCCCHRCWCCYWRVTVSLSAVIPVAGVVVSKSHGAGVTVASAVVNNIGGAVTNIAFHY